MCVYNQVSSADTEAVGHFESIQDDCRENIDDSGLSWCGLGYSCH